MQVNPHAVCVECVLQLPRGQAGGVDKQHVGGCFLHRKTGLTQSGHQLGCTLVIFLQARDVMLDGV